MHGIYAAPASALSARVIFSRRRRSRRLAAPPEGMGQFIDRLYQRLLARGVRFQFGTFADAIDPSCATVIATNAPAAARLLGPHAPAVADAIAAVRMARLTTVTMFFEPRADDLHGFGVLFPAESGIHALGVLFASDIFADRGPARTETWIVGDRDAGLTQWSDARLREVLTADRARLMGQDRAPGDLQVTRWLEAIPIYDAAILRVEATLHTLPPWLALSGNYLGQIGVAALLSVAGAAAARVQPIS
jgi:oxygen-dependent protoporphyrinogen oxidase